MSAVPIADSKESYDSQMMTQYADSQALNMMASVTKSISQLQTLIEDFNLIASHAEDEGADMHHGERMGGKFGRKGMGGYGGMGGISIGGAGRRG